MIVWTIGHSTRSSDDFISILRTHEIETVVDVRRFPGSRRLPQFGSSDLAASLAKSDIGYRWIGELGGRRQPDPNSPNDAWEHPAFRAYADHMASEEFAAGLSELELLAAASRTTVMCAELLWWRCHRRLIADVLIALYYEVRHIRDASAPELHRLGPPGRMVGGVLTYESAERQTELEL